MIIDELEVGPQYRLSKVIRMLENIYSITMDFDAVANEADLKSIYEEYGLIRFNIIRETQHNSYNDNPDYVKACLIQEAIHIFLSEIAPKRRNRSKK